MCSGVFLLAHFVLLWCFSCAVLCRVCVLPVLLLCILCVVPLLSYIILLRALSVFIVLCCECIAFSCEALEGNMQVCEERPFSGW